MYRLDLSVDDNICALYLTYCTSTRLGVTMTRQYSHLLMDDRVCEDDADDENMLRTEQLRIATI